MAFLFKIKGIWATILGTLEVQELTVTSRLMGLSSYLSLGSRAAQLMVPLYRYCFALPFVWKRNFECTRCLAATSTLEVLQGCAACLARALDMQRSSGRCWNRPKYPNKGCLCGSVLASVIVVLGRCLVFGYLDP